MDLLQKCAVAFNRLTGYQYRFTLGRKGKLKEIVLGFGETDFHHLAGLHKLKDINIARDNRQTVFRDSLARLGGQQAQANHFWRIGFTCFFR